jgi:predicted transcriptional regulator
MFSPPRATSTCGVKQPPPPVPPFRRVSADESAQAEDPHRSFRSRPFVAVSIDAELFFNERIRVVFKGVRARRMVSNVRLAAEITAAFLQNNRVEVEAVGELIRSVHRTLIGVAQPSPDPQPELKRRTPSQIKRSIRDEALISFLDGKPYRQLKRHLATYGITPGEYRERFGLPIDYPMVAPAYSRRRSELAKASGLGKKAGKKAASRRRTGGAG